MSMSMIVGGRCCEFLAIEFLNNRCFVYTVCVNEYVPTAACFLILLFDLDTMQVIYLDYDM